MSHVAIAMLLDVGKYFSSDSARVCGHASPAIAEVSGFTSGCANTGYSCYTVMMRGNMCTASTKPHNV